jgi:hypothetical protein
MFKSLPITTREIKATEAILERIYEAAYLGLKEDSLALAAGLLPVEYRLLKQHDKLAEIAELKGRADSEREHSQHMLNAARQGDAKAALEILKHTHGWVAVDEGKVIDVTPSNEKLTHAEAYIQSGRRTTADEPTLVASDQRRS